MSTIEDQCYAGKLRTGAEKRTRKGSEWDLSVLQKSVLNQRGGNSIHLTDLEGKAQMVFLFEVSHQGPTSHPITVTGMHIS